MIRPLLPALCAIVLLSGCDPYPPQHSDDEVVTVDLESQPGDPVPDPPPRAGGMRDEPSDGSPNLYPPRLDPDVERTKTGARSVLGHWARAIEAKEFDQAWAMLTENDHAQWSRAEFASQFQDAGKITVAVATGRMEGAAGSSYYTAPVTITSTGSEGRPLRYEGEAVLRRVNDIPGATAEELRWHFESLSLDRTP